MTSGFEAETVVAACDDVGAAGTGRWVDQDGKFGGEAFVEDLWEGHVDRGGLKEDAVYR